MLPESGNDRHGSVERSSAVERAITMIGRVGGAAGILLTVALLFYEVVSRYLFGRPTQFTLEAGLILQIVIVSTAAAYLLREGGHVGIDLITERLSPRAKAWLGCVHAALGAAVCVLIAAQVWQSAMWSLKINKLTLNMEQPLGPIQLVMVGGLALLCLQFFFNGYRSYRAARSLNGPSNPGGRSGGRDPDPKAVTRP